MRGRRTCLNLVWIWLMFAANLQSQTYPNRRHSPATGDDEKQRSAGDMASTYVPLDSWIYPAFERLAAMGILQTGFAALRPWTRMECARLVAEAEDRLANDETNTEASELYRSLSSEFALELQREDGASNSGMQIESIYSQTISISGRPLTDGYHFARTIANNFGRPFGEGANWYTGAALRAQAGWLAFYVRGEYQRGGTIAALSPTAQAAVAQADFTPTAAQGPSSDVSQFRLLDAYDPETVRVHQSELLRHRAADRAPVRRRGREVHRRRGDGALRRPGRDRDGRGALRPGRAGPAAGAGPRGRRRRLDVPGRHRHRGRAGRRGRGPRRWAGHPRRRRGQHRRPAAGGGSPGRSPAGRHHPPGRPYRDPLGRPGAADPARAVDPDRGLAGPGPRTAAGRRGDRRDLHGRARPRARPAHQRAAARDRRALAAAGHRARPGRHRQEPARTGAVPARGHPGRHPGLLADAGDASRSARTSPTPRWPTS